MVTDFGTNRKLICDFLLVINTNYILFCTVSKFWLNIGQILASDRGSLNFNAFAGGNPLRISG